MEEELDQFPFILAESLGITLAEVESMSNNEYTRWQAWHTYKRAMEDMARDR